MRYASHILLLLILAIIGSLLILTPFSSSYTHGPNYENVTIDTTVNVTESKPVIMSIIIQDAAASITLNAGGNITVYCNVTIRDYNGGDTISECDYTV